MTDNFEEQLRYIRNEQDFHAFINRNASDPRVVKMLQMTQGKNPQEIMGIAGNLANTSKVDLNQIKQSFGF